MNGSLWAPGQLALGKIILTPTLDAHTPFNSLSCPAAPKWNPYTQGSSRFFHYCLWATRIKEQNGCFPENWHWTEGRKRLFQFKHVLISGEVETGEGQNWLKNQWESHKFCLLSQQRKFFTVPPTPFSLLYEFG